MRAHNLVDYEPVLDIIMGMRLNKYLAAAHVASRRQADLLIEEGRVTVNGLPAFTGCKVEEGDLVCLDGERIEPDKEKTILAFYKPVGVVCTEQDEHAEVMLSDVLDYPVRLAYAGRLDKDSEGLLLLTDDGDLIQAMMKAKNMHEKEYEVEIRNQVTSEFLTQMSEGIFLKELNRITRPCKTRKTGKKSFRIILTQGMNRQIRRMCAALGEEVVRLKRIRVVNVELLDLKPGEYREVTGEERALLYKMVGMKDERTEKNAGTD